MVKARGEKIEVGVRENRGDVGKREVDQKKEVRVRENGGDVGKKERIRRKRWE